MRFNENASNPKYDFLKGHEDRLRYEFHQEILGHLGKIMSRLSLIGKGSVKAVNSELTVIEEKCYEEEFVEIEEMSRGAGSGKSNAKGLLKEKLGDCKDVCLKYIQIFEDKKYWANIVLEHRK